VGLPWEPASACRRALTVATPFIAPSPRRLRDVEHSEGRLYLVFEWVDRDLKKYMDSCPGGMSMAMIKVRGAATCRSGCSRDA
jgi:hypothetical protein